MTVLTSYTMIMAACAFHSFACSKDLSFEGGRGDRLSYDLAFSKFDGAELM